MAINSRKKGAKNEREIAKTLELWSGKKFAKTPASGGLNWKTSNVAGDVVCVTEGHYFPFCIEGKSYLKIDFSHLLTPGIKNVDILGFWEQAKRDATKANKIPILLIRYNGLPKHFWFLAIEESYYIQLPATERNLITTKLTYSDETTNTKLVITRSTEFFKTNYKEIKAHAKKFIKKRRIKS